jgi:hypothetical protein
MINSAVNSLKPVKPNLTLTPKVASFIYLFFYLTASSGVKFLAVAGHFISTKAELSSKIA